MLINFVSYLRNKGEVYNKILKEMEKIQQYKSQGRPKYWSMMIRFSLLLRYSSCHTNKLLLEQLPLDIVHLIKNIRNNLLSRKKFVFPSSSFDKCGDIIDVPEVLSHGNCFMKYRNSEIIFCS